MARLTSPRGSRVNVADDKVEGLLAQGFTVDGGTTPARKATAKKSASSKSEK